VQGKAANVIHMLMRDDNQRGFAQRLLHTREGFRIERRKIAAPQPFIERSIDNHAEIGIDKPVGEDWHLARTPTVPRHNGCCGKAERSDILEFDLFRLVTGDGPDHASHLAYIELVIGIFRHAAFDNEPVISGACDHQQNCQHAQQNTKPSRHDLFPTLQAKPGGMMGRASQQINVQR